MGICPKNYHKQVVDTLSWAGLLAPIAIVLQLFLLGENIQAAPPSVAITMASGMAVGVDAATGAFIPPSQLPVQQRPASPPGVGSPPTWVTLPVPASRGGGVMLDMQGKGLHTMRLLVDGHGGVRGNCRQDQEGAGHEK